MGGDRVQWRCCWVLLSFGDLPCKRKKGKIGCYFTLAGLVKVCERFRILGGCGVCGISSR